MSFLNQRLGITFVAFATMGILISACGTKRKLDEMHDATVSMDKKTTELGENTGKLVTKTDKLDEKTAEMYDALKQGDSLNARRLGLAGILAAHSVAAKVSEAGKYFMSFEYQVWSGIGLDTEEKRLEVASSAAREFMKDVQEFIPNDEELVAVPLVRGEGDAANRLRGLNAISVAMHLLNPKQEHMLKSHPTLKEISAMGMIQESLKARIEIDQETKRIEDFPAYVKDILVYQSIAEFLLQVRYNFLGAMTLARLKAKSEIKKAGLNSQINEWKNKILEYALPFTDVPNTMNLSTTMEVDLKKFNLVEVREFARYLKAAIKTSDFLNSIGVPPKIDPMLLGFYQSLNVGMSAVQVKAETTGKVSERVLAEVEFADLINRYKESGEKGLSGVVAPSSANVTDGGSSTVPAIGADGAERKSIEIRPSTQGQTAPQIAVAKKVPMKPASASPPTSLNAGGL